MVGYFAINFVLKIYSQLEQKSLSLRYEDDILSNMLPGTENYSTS